MAQGPLAGTRVIEMAAIGPVPHAGLVLAGLGVDVMRIDRTTDAALGIGTSPRFDALGRGKRAVALDLKTPAGVGAALHLIAGADAVIEGFRPGVMERLGLGPDVCLAENRRLVYGRISGWGDSGPLRDEAGHDLNYVGLTGALAAMGTPGEPPPVPLNLIGDFGGAAMQLVVGVLAAMLHACATGQGQIVATSIFEGAAALTPLIHGLRAAGKWRDERGANILDGGAPFYRTYATADGGHVAVGAIEAKFYAALLAGLSLPDVRLADQMDRARWPATTALFAARFAARSLSDWSATFAGTDACVSPVLGWSAAAAHPQSEATGAYRIADGQVVPRPVPRFSRTPAPDLGPAPGAENRTVSPP